MNNGDLYEARIVCTQGVQTAINVRHYLVSAKLGTGPTDAQFATNLDVLFQAVYKGLLATQATYRGVGVRKITPLPIGLESSSVANIGAGTMTGGALPRQTSGVLSLRTAFGGRRYRGRVFLPFPGEDDSDAAGLPSAAYVANLGALGVAMIAARVGVGAGGNTATLSPVIYSRIGILTTPVLSWVARGAWGTMRTRGDFGRANLPPF